MRKQNINDEIKLYHRAKKVRDAHEVPIQRLNKKTLTDMTGRAS
jgi:hypothetical protein